MVLTVKGYSMGWCRCLDVREFLYESGADGPVPTHQKYTGNISPLGDMPTERAEAKKEFGC